MLPSDPAAPVGLDLDALKELLARVGDDAPLLGEALQFKCDFEDLSLDGQALIVAAVNALPALLDLVSRQQDALVKTQWAPISHLLNEHQMVDDEWPEGVEPHWNSPCMLNCGGGSFHGHAEGCALRSLLPREPQT
jgi:hypothetical protein